MTPALSTMPPALSTMPPGRLFRAYVIEAKFESLRMLRAPAFAGPFLTLPVALLLLFGVLLFGAELAKDPKSALYMFAGLCTFGVMGPGLFGFGVTLATEREQGLWRLKRALPMPPAASLLAKMLMAALFVVLIMVTMMLAAPLAHVKLGAAQAIALTLVNVAGSLPFCALGLFIGTLASAKAAPAIVNVLYLPMIYLSAILFPLPASVKWIASFSPAFHLEQLALTAIWAPHDGAPAVHLAFLAAITLAASALAVRRLERVG